jgi:MFS family permease
MNVLYALSAWPFGIAFDRLGEHRLLILSLLLLVAALLCLGLATTPVLSVLGASLWGLHLGSSQGLLSALIAHHAPSAKRGRSFGVYAFCCGIALLLNGVAFGALWQQQSATFAFISNAVMTTVVLLCSIPLLQRLRRGLG